MATPDEKSVRDQLATLLASEDFPETAINSRKLLGFVVEQALSGEGGGLKESTIGIAVYDRAPGYDMQADSIVRAEAGRLRKRLEKYYDHAGKFDKVVIEIPKGRYVPRFSNKDENTQVSTARGDAGWKRVLRSMGRIWRVPVKNQHPISVIGTAILIIALTGMGLYYRQLFADRSDPNSILILVADFERDPNREPYRITRTLFTKLKEATAKISGVRVEPLEAAIPWRTRISGEAFVGRQIAIAEGKRRHAAFVVWGDYDSTSQSVVVTAHIEILAVELQQPREIFFEREVPIVELETFVIQKTLANYAHYVVSSVVGMVYFRRQQYQEAINLFTNSLMEPVSPGESPGRMTVYLFLGAACLESQRFDCAIENLTNSLQLSPGNPEILSERGIAYAVSERWDLAEKDFREAKSSATTNTQRILAQDLLGRLFLEKKQYGQAIAEYEVTLKAEPDNLPALEGLACAQRDSGRPRAALETWRRVAELSPASADALYGIGSQEYRLGRTLEAYSYVKKALELDPNFFEARLLGGILLTDQKQLEKAVHEFTSVIEADFSIWKAHLKRHSARQSLRFWKLGDVDMFKANALLGRSRSRLLLGDSNGALRDAQTSLDLRPEGIWWFDNCGDFDAEYGRFDAAIAACDVATVLKPNLAGPWISRAGWLHDAGRDSDAAHDLERALQLNKNLPRAWTARGFLRLELGDILDAEKDFEVALLLQPKAAYAYAGRAHVRENQGKLRSAILDFDRAIALEPEEGDLRWQRADRLCTQGLYDSAMADYAGALERKPEDFAIFNNRADCLTRQGNLTQAAIDATEAIRLRSSDPHAYETRGNISIRMSKWDAALADFEAALRIKPDYDEALVGKATALAEIGRSDEARLRRAPELTHLCLPRMTQAVCS